MHSRKIMYFPHKGVYFGNLFHNILITINCIQTCVVILFPLGKSPETALVKEALHRELLPVSVKVNQIKELLSRPSIRMKIYKELLEQGQLS